MSIEPNGIIIKVNQEFDFIPTDVYSYHVDRSPIATDTFLCTYHGAASDIIANDQAEQKILIPEIRNQGSLTQRPSGGIGRLFEGKLF